MHGKTLRTIRKLLGLTQAMLAAQLGVAPNTVARWERGERSIPEPVARFDSTPEGGEGLTMKVWKRKDRDVWVIDYRDRTGKRVRHGRRENPRGRVSRLFPNANSKKPPRRSCPLSRMRTSRSRSMPTDGSRRSSGISHSGPIGAITQHCHVASCADPWGRETARPSPP